MKLLFLSLLFLLGVSAFTPSNYANTQLLQPKYRIHWSRDGDYMNLALEVETTGWIGFGLGESTSGSMPGADIVTATIANGKTTIYDRFALEKDYPPEDTCNHWILINGEESNGKTIVELRRLIDTKDKQDRAFEATNKVVIAWGYTDTWKEHDEKYAIQVNFWVEDNANQRTVPKELPFFPFASFNYTIPPQKTTYADFYFNVPIPPQDVHAIAFDPIFNESTRKYVHHFVLFGSEVEGNRVGSSLDPSWSVLWAWAPGIIPFVFPNNVGMKFGPTGIKSIRLQIHFDNPKFDVGVIDTGSGVNIYYNTSLRQYDAGVFETGDMFVRNPTIIPVGTGHSAFEYSCPADCSAKFPGPLHVFQIFLHMHQVGAQMWGTQWRNGSFIRETNRVDFFDFAFQQHTPVEFDILPGDRINTHCVYKQTNVTTKFGQGSEDEMCVQYMFYYPKYNMQYCGFFQVNKSLDVSNNATYCNYTIVPTQKNPDIHDPVGLEFIKFGTANEEGFECPKNITTTATVIVSSSDSKSNEISDKETEDTNMDESSASILAILVSVLLFVLV